MDKADLVAAELSQARHAVSAIERAGLPIFAAAAIWSRPIDRPRILISSPDVEKHGPSAVIRFIDQVLRELHSPFRIHDIYVVNQKDHVAAQVAGYFGGTKRLFRFGDRPDFQSSLEVFEDGNVKEGIILVYNPRSRASEKPPKLDEAALVRARAA